MIVDSWSAVWISIQVATIATLLSTPLSLSLGWLLARRRFRGKSIVAIAVASPLVLPPVVTGYLLLELFGRGGPLGGLGVAFSLAGAVIAALVVGLPLYALFCRSAFEAVDPAYEEVAWTLGATPRRAFLRVTLPLAYPGLAAGAVLAFARALGEFGATVVLAGNQEGQTRTIALAVDTLLEMPGEQGQIRWLALASLSLSAGAVLCFEVLRRRLRTRLELDT